jgi:RNA 2',3'-cyclic 3'-phosphodiesterase
MRIFIAIDIDDSIRQRLQGFLDGVREFAPEARWVRPESLHVTLKFIGEKSADHVEKIQRALAEVKSPSFDLKFQGYGFFPTPKAARVFWVGIESGPQLAELAGELDGTMASLGIPKEDHAFSPHLTLARRGGGSGAPRWHEGDAPNRSFQHLREKLAALPPPEFGTMTAHAFFLYQSQLMRGGSRYTKIAGFPLG